jgi:AraC family transcriptional regulator
VLRRRISVGAEMLLANNESISAIALELGFADQSHFTMHFKRVHGVGPAGYRRQHLR